MCKKVLSAAMAFMPLLLQAQSLKPHWYNVTQFGWLMGDNQHTYSLQTINGITLNRLSTGIGVAYDKYGYSSMPVFADVRYNLAVGKNPLQAYGNAGVNVAFTSSRLPANYPGGGDVYHTMRPSFYGEIGLDYKLKLAGKFFILAGAGYNYKTFKYIEHGLRGTGISPQANTYYTFHYSKYVVRIGFGIK